MPVRSKDHADLPATVHPALIRAVAAGSPAAAAGVAPGWSLVAVNGRAIPDILAYRRELGQGEASLAARSPDGEIRTFTVRWEDPGLEFEEVIFDGLRLCANKCEFCYVHQMPKGFRRSLYVMDDDFRTSFLYGSFITLSNLGEEDVRRILDEHLSPLYVSVHTTDDALRKDLMRWWRLKVRQPSATRLGEMLDRLQPIDLYTQIVLVPGRNDGHHLEKTLRDLAARPNIQAVAVVPVGLTGHRTNLPELRPYRREEAEAVVSQVLAFQREMLARTGSRFAFLSDEFFLVAGLPVPAEEEYEGFPMLENGVGMVRDFLQPLPPLPVRLQSARRVLLATGTLFAPVLDRAVAPLRAIEGLDLEVRALQNLSFGEPTTVAGLLAGRDLLEQISPGEAELLLLSPSVLKFGTELLLDGVTLGDLRSGLGMEVRVGGANLTDLAASILQDATPESKPQFGFSTHALKESSRQH